MGERKFIALLKAFDRELAGQWHSGSCTYYKSKIGLASQEEANQAIGEFLEYYRNDTKRYSFTCCTLSYDESESKNVEEFFKYM